MFDVLVYLYENYWRPDACPDHDQLTRKLSAVGFESDDIEEALIWLDGRRIPRAELETQLVQDFAALAAVAAVGDDELAAVLRGLLENEPGDGPFADLAARLGALASP